VKERERKRGHEYRQRPGVKEQERELRFERLKKDPLYGLMKRLGVLKYSLNSDCRKMFGQYTPEDVLLLLEVQGGRCALCHTPFDGFEFYIDHDHDSGKLRGLLCNRCNSAEGYIRKHGRDPIDWAHSLVAYLERPPMEQTEQIKDLV